LRIGDCGLRITVEAPIHNPKLERSDMSGFSDYWENEILDHLFSKGAYAAPAIYVALSTSDPGDDGSGAAEPAGGSYTRIETCGADWTDAGGGCIDNADAIQFPQATDSWGTITHFALYDGLTGGHLLACGALASSLPVAAGDLVRFAPGELNVTLD